MTAIFGIDFAHYIAIASWVGEKYAYYAGLDRLLLVKAEPKVKTTIFSNDATLLELCNARYIFSSNHNIQKSPCGLNFWTSDPLIDRFFKNLTI